MSKRADVSTCNGTGANPSRVHSSVLCCSVLIWLVLLVVQCREWSRTFGMAMVPVVRRHWLCCCCRLNKRRVTLI